MSVILDLAAAEITDLSGDPIYDLQGSGSGRARADGRTRVLLGRHDGRTLYFRRLAGRDSSLLAPLRGESDERTGREAISGKATGREFP